MQACMYALPEEMHGYIGMFYGYVRARVRCVGTALTGATAGCSPSPASACVAPHPPAARALTRCTGLPHAPEHPAPLALARRHVRARAARARRVVVRRRRGRDRRVHDAHRVRRRGGHVRRACRVVRDGEHDGLVARAARRAVRAREPEQIQYWGIQGVTGVQEDRVSVSGRAFVCAPARRGG
jgi:hypothetical protein